MVKRGWGRIIRVTTSLGSMLRAGMAGYAGSRAALEAHTAVLAGDLAHTGVTANVLIPGGAANTPMVPLESAVDRAQLLQPEAMVAPALWLASTESDGVTAKRLSPPIGIRPCRQVQPWRMRSCPLAMPIGHWMVWLGRADHLSRQLRPGQVRVGLRRIFQPYSLEDDGAASRRPEHVLRTRAALGRWRRPPGGRLKGACSTTSVRPCT
jgi:hypothetical protein